MDKKHFFLELSKVLAWPGVVVVVVAWFVFLAFLAGVNNWKPITDLINVLIWPGVVAVVLLAFYRPLAAFIGGLGGRVTKFSAFQISIELANATLPSPLSPWSDPSNLQGSEMAGGEASSTTFMGLFMRIEAGTPWDYLIVDIKDGHYWLISRVFIFTVFLQVMGGMKCVVFVESKEDHCRNLIGLASPDAVRRALSEKYDWLERALSNAMITNQTFFLSPSLSSGIAGNIIQSFLNDKEMRRDGPSYLDEKWAQLGIGTQPFWEHTEWFNIEKVNEYLRNVFYEWDSSHYEDTPDIQTDQRTRELICRKAPFIALVNSKGEFQRLLDRQKLLERIAPFLQNDRQTDTL